MNNSEDLFQQQLRLIHCAENAPLFSQLQQIIAPHCTQIAQRFYDAMISNGHAIRFLNHEEVEKHLKESMTRWLHSLITYHDHDLALEAYFHTHLQIGYVHARIELPFSLFCLGMSIIKSELLQRVHDSGVSNTALYASITLVNQTLDWSLAVIGDTYQTNAIANIKESQSFKSHMSAQNLAGDYKHLCISLSEWMRDLLLAIQKNQYQNSHKPSIRRSDFGLWIGHKAHLFLDDAELDGLLDLLDVMDDELRILQTELNDPEQACNSLDRLNNAVSQTIALLSNIAKNTTQVDNAKDTLTQLFNERYLNNILRHEMAYSLRHDILFGITHIDIDSFKQINEQYGHDNGDKILLQLANVLSKQVRAGDFVFRLKGGEFLIILVDINAIMLSKVAEKIREAVEGVVFELDKAATLFITVSIGAALHNRHPDFERTIKLASNALYEAKNTGKNKVVSVS